VLFNKFVTLGHPLAPLPFLLVKFNLAHLFLDFLFDVCFLFAFLLVFTQLIAVLLCILFLLSLLIKLLEVVVWFGLRWSRSLTECKCHAW
jgi:hypothetical protein